MLRVYKTETTHAGVVQSFDYFSPIFFTNNSLKKIKLLLHLRN